MIYKSDEELKRAVELKESELNKAKAEYEERIEKKRIQELAKKVFDDKFGLNFVSDNYNIYPQDLYFQIEAQFLNGFYEDDNSYNEHLLQECRENYIKDLEDGVSQLQELLDNIKKQFKEMKK